MPFSEEDALPYEEDEVSDNIWNGFYVQWFFKAVCIRHLAMRSFQFFMFEKEERIYDAHNRPARVTRRNKSFDSCFFFRPSDSERYLSRSIRSARFLFARISVQKVSLPLIRRFIHITDSFRLGDHFVYFPISWVSFAYCSRLLSISVRVAPSWILR